MGFGLWASDGKLTPYRQKTARNPPRGTVETWWTRGGKLVETVSGNLVDNFGEAKWRKKSLTCGCLSGSRANIRS